MKKTGFFKSPIGYIKYVYQDMKIYQMSLIFDDEISDVFDVKINASLTEYFEGKLRKFPFDYEVSNKTIFQQKVYQALLTIPYGKTKSYSDIALEIGHPNAVRAVGQACKSNPIAIMIPCHRVIGKNKQLTGYQGKDYIFLKEKLINLEKKFLS